MDRLIGFPGENFQAQDIDKTNKYAMVGLGKFVQAILGNGPFINGLSCVPAIPATLHVTLNPGEIYQVGNTDTSGYGPLPPDTHPLVKQGILLDTQDFVFIPPATPGQSINFLIQIQQRDQDVDNETRTFYQAPSQVVPTRRQSQLYATQKAGTPATTGTQTTPTPDSGFIGAWVVTVANGQTQIQSGDITMYPGAPFITETLTQKISQAFADARYALKASVPVNKSYFQGFNIVNNSSDSNNDIDFGAGECKDNTGASLIALASTLTKRLDAAWVAGNNQGGLFSGSKAASTTYHFFVILKDSDGSVDCGFDTSITAANKPVGYSKYRRIFSLFTDSSSNWTQIVNNGDEILLNVPVNDFTAAEPPTTAVLRTLFVPSGISVLALTVFNLDTTYDVTPINCLITSPYQADTAPTDGINTLRCNGTESSAIANSIYGRFRTNTSAQVRTRLDLENAGTTLRSTTFGWIDDRGRFGF